MKIRNCKLGVTVHFTGTASYRAPLKIAGCPCAITLLSNPRMRSSIVQARHTPQRGKNLIAFAPKKTACFLGGNALPLVCLKKKKKVLKLVVFLASIFSPRLYYWRKDKNLTSYIDHKPQPWVHRLLTDAGRMTDEQEDSERTSYLKPDSQNHRNKRLNSIPWQVLSQRVKRLIENKCFCGLNAQCDKAN